MSISYNILIYIELWNHICSFFTFCRMQMSPVSQIDLLLFSMSDEEKQYGSVNHSRPKCNESLSLHSFANQALFVLYITSWSQLPISDLKCQNLLNSVVRKYLHFYSSRPRFLAYPAWHIEVTGHTLKQLWQ